MTPLSTQSVTPPIDSGPETKALFAPLVTSLTTGHLPSASWIALVSRLVSSGSQLLSVVCCVRRQDAGRVGRGRRQRRLGRQVLASMSEQSLAGRRPPRPTDRWCRRCRRSARDRRRCCSRRRDRRRRRRRARSAAGRPSRRKAAARRVIVDEVGGVNVGSWFCARAPGKPGGARRASVDRHRRSVSSRCRSGRATRWCWRSSRSGSSRRPGRRSSRSSVPPESR